MRPACPSVLRVLLVAVGVVPTSLQAQSLLGPQDAKAALPSDAAGIIQVLRAEWGLDLHEAADGVGSYQRAGDDLAGSLEDSDMVVRSLVAQIRRAGKLIDGRVADQSGEAIKKSMALAESRIRGAVDGLVRSESSVEEARRAVRAALSDYLTVLGALAGS